MVLITTKSATALPMAPPNTRSPTLKPSAFSPISSTTPAKSYPNPDGAAIPKFRGRVGNRATAQSIGFRPAEVTRTRTSPAPGCGSGTSRNSKTSGPRERLVHDGSTHGCLQLRSDRTKVHHYSRPMGLSAVSSIRWLDGNPTHRNVWLQLLSAYSRNEAMKPRR